MPFCNQCGKPVGNQDQFCGSCGGRQPEFKKPTDHLGGISPRTVSLLCYIPFVGWVVAIVALASTRFRGDTRVRFNAFQGLYLFVAWLIVDWVLTPLFGIPYYWGSPAHHVFPNLMKFAVLCVWIFMIVKTAHDELYKLPILGELAEKSVSEQR